MLQNANALRLSRARWITIDSRWRPLPAKYGDAEALTISVAPAVASSDPGGPGTQMSSHTVSPTRTPPRSTTAPLLAGLEVALLVEDAVVRQPVLAVERLHLAVGHDRERVVDVLDALGRADERDDALGLARDVERRLARRLEEVLLEQQVLRRVAGDRELGEEHELGALVAGARDPLADLARVALEVADAGVDLGERDAQRFERSGHASDITPRAGSSRRGPRRSPCRARSRRTRAAPDRRGPTPAGGGARPAR